MLLSYYYACAMFYGFIERLCGENVKPRQSKGIYVAVKSINRTGYRCFLVGFPGSLVGLLRGISFLCVDRAFYGKKRAPSVANVRTRVNCNIERGSMRVPIPIHNGVSATVQRDDGRKETEPPRRQARQELAKRMMVRYYLTTNH
jgi:hypothetical protein